MCVVCVCVCGGGGGGGVCVIKPISSVDMLLHVGAYTVGAGLVRTDTLTPTLTPLHPYTLTPLQGLLQHFYAMSNVHSFCDWTEIAKKVLCDLSGNLYSYPCRYCVPVLCTSTGEIIERSKIELHKLILLGKSLKIICKYCLFYRIENPCYL